MSSFRIPLYRLRGFDKVHEGYVVHFDLRKPTQNTVTSTFVDRDTIQVLKLDGSGFMKANETTGSIKLSLAQKTKYSNYLNTNKFFIGSQINMLSRSMLLTLNLNLNKTEVKPTIQGVTQVKKGQFVVGTIIDGVLKLSSDPKIHLSEAGAKAEASRLAASLPGKEFVVLGVSGVVKATGVVWS